MAAFNVYGTEFTFTILKKRLLSDGFWARVELGVQNEYISYHDILETITREELEEWIFSMFRLLAGAYATQRTLNFERAGLAVDLQAYTENGREVSRQVRRENDCKMAIQFLLRSKDKKKHLGGVQSFVLHRGDIQKFAQSLREEFNEAFGKLVHGRGKYRFVGVSPMGYAGCNYWYFDPTDSVETGDRVWVRMGRHNTEQIAIVDSVRFFDDETAPYDPQTVKRILKKATEQEKEL